MNKFLRTLLAGLVAGSIAVAAEPAPAKSSSEMMRELRLMWLTKPPEKGSYKTDTEVVAVLMDWPLGEKVATVFSSSVGDASLYTTPGFGILGGIGHAKVRKASTDFVGCAQRFLDITSPTSDFAYPDSTTLRFFMVTPSGVRQVSFPISEIEKEGTPARTLFTFGQEVLTQLRLTMPKSK